MTKDFQLLVDFEENPEKVLKYEALRQENRKPSDGLIANAFTLCKDAKEAGLFAIDIEFKEPDDMKKAIAASKAINAAYSEIINVKPDFLSP